MDYSINTKCVQAGYTPGNGEPRQIPIYQSTTYKYDTSEDMGKLFDLEASGYFYSRLQNPTNDYVAAKITALEGGTAGMLTSSGQAANFFAIFNICEAGSHIVSSSSIYGGALEDMDSTMETWSYESLCFYVDKDGIESMTYSNPYTIGNIKTENLNLLSFSEVMKIYEKMMLVTNADNMQYENSRAYNIDRIVLGYARIYEPSTDAHTGILIPVWDFFGSMTSESEYNGETESNTSKDPNESFLTINAVDGSIIDRNLGY